MKNKLIVLISVLMFSISGYSQNDLGTVDDYGRITLTSVLPTLKDVPDHAKKLLITRLQQVATKNGLGGVSIQPRFLLTATVTVIDKEITPTAPPMVAMNMDIELFIIDYVSKKIFSTVTLSVKGVGKNDTKAYLQGIKRINPKSSKVRSFIKKGKQKIIEHYNTECVKILKEVDAIVKLEKYPEAIHHLMTIPEVCQDCYFKALAKIDPIYQKMIGNNCKEDYKAAKEAFNNENYAEAKKHLENIEPGTDCFDKAVDLSKKINALDEEVRGDEIVMQAAAPATRDEKVKKYKEVANDHNQNNPNSEDYDVEFVEE